MLHLQSTQGIAHLALFMSFLSDRAREEGSKSSNSTDNYLNPSKLEDGDSVRFCLLQENPIDFFEVWGSLTEDPTKSRPYRFEGDPTPEDISEAMGTEATRRLNFDGTAPDPAKLAIAIAIYNYDAGRVQVLQFSQKTLITQLDQIAQMEDYRDDLLAFDFSLSRTGVKKDTKYSLICVPQRKNAKQEKDEAWEQVKADGFDIYRLIDGTDPFKQPTA